MSVSALIFQYAAGLLVLGALIAGLIRFMGWACEVEAMREYWD